MCIYILLQGASSYKLICKPHEYEFVISPINPNVTCSPTFSSKDITSKTSSFLDSIIIFHHLKPRGFPMVSSVFRHVSHPFFHGPNRVSPPRLAAAAWSAPANNPRRWSPGPQGPDLIVAATACRVNGYFMKTAHELIGYIVIYIYIYVYMYVYI